MIVYKGFVIDDRGSAYDFLKMLLGSRVEVDEFIRLLGVDISYVMHIIAWFVKRSIL